MCCFPITFSEITAVKVMRDGDGDGRCQEENGKWVPCPPGVATGTRLRNGKPLGERIGDMSSLASPPKPSASNKPAPALPRSSEDAGDAYIRNSDAPNFREWLEARGIDNNSIGLTERHKLFEEYDRLLIEKKARQRKEEFEKIREQYPDFFDEDGNVNPQIVDEYVTLNREKAKERAERIAAQAENEISDESRKAARRIQKPFTPDEYDLRQEYEYDNRRPEEEDFSDDDEGRREFRQALNEWENDRDLFIENALAGSDGSEMIGDIETAFNHRMIGKDGRTYESQVVRTYWDEYEGWSIYGTINDAITGEQVGSFNRTLFYGGDDNSVYHDSLSFKEEFQGLGLASQFNAMNEIVYRQMGISLIKVTGASGGGMHGASHWPAQGFNWDDEYVKRDFLEAIQDALLQGKIKDPKEAAILQELINIAEDQSWWQRNALVAGDFVQWDGIKKYFKDRGFSFSYSRDI